MGHNKVHWAKPLLTAPCQGGTREVEPSREPPTLPFIPPFPRCEDQRWHPDRCHLSANPRSSQGRQDKEAKHTLPMAQAKMVKLPQLHSSPPPHTQLHPYWLTITLEATSTTCTLFCQDMHLPCPPPHWARPDSFKLSFPSAKWPQKLILLGVRAWPMLGTAALLNNQNPEPS